MLKRDRLTYKSITCRALEADEKKMLSTAQEYWIWHKFELKRQQ